jgi:hypothetical protein
MRRQKRNAGFVLLSAAAGILTVIAMLGLATDVGRLYIVKTELQGYADIAAMAAAQALDGTAQGIVSARAVAQTGFGAGATPNRWNFATESVSTPLVTFSSLSGAGFSSAPESAAGVRFVNVRLDQSVRLYFLPVLPGVAATSPVSASAIAGQAVQNSMGAGLAPFTPSAHNPADSNFGFTIGGDYTLKWPPAGQEGKPNNRCSGDIGFVPNKTSEQRGYMDVGQGSGNSALHAAVVNNDFNLASQLSIGSAIAFLSGTEHVGPAMAERFGQDTDQTAATYSTYTGNGRRILIAAVNSNTPAALVVGFGAFFLRPNACANGNAGVCCAEYIGSALSFSSRKGAAVDGGLYAVKLFQ